MLKNTFADVRFNNGISDKWKINKRSRQGCKIGLVRWNVLAYADDIVLMAPSLNGLQV